MTQEYLDYLLRRIKGGFIDVQVAVSAIRERSPSTSGAAARLALKEGRWAGR
jgi:hypothetical protein